MQFMLFLFPRTSHVFLTVQTSPALQPSSRTWLQTSGHEWERGVTKIGRQKETDVQGHQLRVLGSSRLVGLGLVWPHHRSSLGAG